jgi:hypothetical protein
LAPSRSPDSSVAIRNIFRATFAAAGVGCLDHVLRVDHDGIAGDDRNPGKLGRRRTFDGSRPHRREIETQILSALGCLH